MWLHLPASCLSSLATADWTLPFTQPVEPTLWCWSNGTPSPRPSSWRGWRKRPWRRLLSGTTCPPSMADAGVASWIASLAAAPARTSPSPGSGVALLRLVPASGGRCSASPTRQGLLSFSGRTSEAPSRPHWTWSRKTLRTSASELRRALSALTTWVRPTSASASSSWPTPSATPYGHQQSPSPGTAVRPSLQTLAASWPTPTATDAKGSGSAGYSTASGRHSGVTLTDAAVRQWPTPRASDGAKGGPNQTAARDERDNRGSGTPHGRHSDSLPVQVRRGTPGMVLNPAFVEALMGLSAGWTSPTPMSASASSATASSGSRRQRRSLSVGNDSSREVTP